MSTTILVLGDHVQSLHPHLILKLLHRQKGILLISWSNWMESKSSLKTSRCLSVPVIIEYIYKKYRFPVVTCYVKFMQTIFLETLKLDLIRHTGKVQQDWNNPAAWKGDAKKAVWGRSQIRWSSARTLQWTFTGVFSISLTFKMSMTFWNDGLTHPFSWGH